MSVDNTSDPSGEKVSEAEPNAKNAKNDVQPVDVEITSGVHADAEIATTKKEFDAQDFPDPVPPQEDETAIENQQDDTDAEEQPPAEIHSSRVLHILGIHWLRVNVRAFLKELFEADQKPRAGIETHIDIRSVVGTDRLIRRGGLFALVCLSIFVAWATFAPLSEGIISSGQVIVETRRKSVQHLEGGIVSQLSVVEGSEVEEGEILMELDATSARANFSLLESRLYSQLARFDRLQAERDEAPSIAYSPEIQQGIAAGDATVTEIVEQQEEIFASRLSRVTGETDIIQQRIAQLQEQGRGLQIQFESASAQLALIREELNRLERLREQNVIDLTTLSAKQREFSSAEGEVGRLRSEIAGNKVAIVEAETQRMQILLQFQQDVSNEILEVQDAILETREQVANATAVLERTVIRSPQRGKVLNLRAFTIGGVIPPGEVIMEIVPVDDDLVVETQVNVTDIDNVYVGQPVRAILSAFNSRTTPELNGYVESIAADVQYDPQGQIPPYYMIRINFTEKELSRLPENVVIKPGMPVEAFIQGQQRTALKYLFAPISEGLRNSLVE